MNHISSRAALAALTAETERTTARSDAASKVSAPLRQQLMRRIGVFELIDGEYVGHIATLHFKCKAIIKENPYRTQPNDPPYVVLHQDAEVFYPDIGYAWDRETEGTQVPYMTVHIDDPSFAKTIVAVLVKGYKNTYNLYWDRVTIADEDIEGQYVTEELKPYIGVFRPIDKVTDYLISIYPSLQEIWDPD